MGRKNSSRTKNRSYRQKMRQYNNRSRLFNGNIRNPGEFIFIWALILAYIVGMGIFCVSLGWHGKGSYEYHSGNFVKSYRKDDKVIIVTDEGEYSAWASLCDTEKIFTLEEGGTLELITAKDDLLAASCGGIDLLRLEDSEREMREGVKTVLIIFGVMVSVWAAFVAFSVWVMCGAHRLPRKLVTAFVKPSYLQIPPNKK